MSFSRYPPSWGLQKKFNQIKYPPLMFARKGLASCWPRLSCSLASRARCKSSVSTKPLLGGPSLGAGKDGDALTFLTCENGTTPWNVTETGAAVMSAEITYGLFVPQNVNNMFSYTFPGVADADGYEQGCPFKWLLRRQDPVAAIPPDPTIPVNWTTTFLNRPALTVPAAGQQVVAHQLLGFRVLASGPVWQIELKAVAVEDAAHTIGVGPTALGNTSYTLVQQFTIAGHN